MTQSCTASGVDLQAILRRSEVTAIQAIEVHLIGNRVMLRGVVGSFYHKQLAQELVKAGSQGLEIENQICVEYSESELTSDWLESERD